MLSKFRDDLVKEKWKFFWSMYGFQNGFERKKGECGEVVWIKEKMKGFEIKVYEN